MGVVIVEPPSQNRSTTAKNWGVYVKKNKNKIKHRAVIQRGFGAIWRVGTISERLNHGLHGKKGYEEIKGID